MAMIDPKLRTSTVEELMDIVVDRKHTQDCWKWVQQCTSGLQRNTSLEVDEIAQALLFAKVADWPLKDWRLHLHKFRNWHNRNKQAITHSNKHKAICDLGVGIDRMAKTWRTSINKPCFRIRSFGIFVPADWKVWGDYRLTESDFIDVTRLVIIQDDFTIEPATFTSWDAQVKDHMEKWRCQEREKEDAQEELERYRKSLLH